jgi:peptidoglycan/xylan/chitin deacetylase (PgdA/CDA1 family)
MSARWLRSRFGGGALILGYHRVAVPVWDPYEMCVTPQRFAEQLAALRDHAHPMPLPVLVRAFADGTLPPRAVAVTFDDGYADVLTHAKPVLDRYRIPATVFVTSGYLGREYWWDTLERLLRPPRPLPARISVAIGRTHFDWPGQDQHGDERTALLLALCDRLRPLAEAERQVALERIRDEFSPLPASGDPDQRAMTPDGLIALCADGLVEIGSHTATHPVLAALPPAGQRQELLDSKVRLEAIVRRPVTSFSYPNGSASAQTPALVRETGYTCACASHWDVARPGGDPFRLPRFWVPDMEGVRFRRWLKRWLPGPATGSPA